MKKYTTLFVLSSLFALVFLGCDKVEFPYQQQATIKLDTTLYPGLWQDYLDNEYPVFPNNTNTLRNALLEEYTGHLCNNCPTAATVAKQLHEANPNRVFVAKIHADPGSLLGFQSFNPNGSSFYTDHTNPEGIIYGKEFESGFNFTGNPSGNVNRKFMDGKMFDLYGTWQTRVTDILNSSDLMVNMQSVFNYFPATNGGFLHLEIEKLTSDEIPMKVVSYVIQDTLVDWQLMPNNTPNPDYIHRWKHLGSIDGNAWGVDIFPADAPAGEKMILDYSYALPSNLAKENMQFLLYVYHVETYEILQVIRQRIE
jgi:hypothetical protein